MSIAMEVTICVIDNKPTDVSPVYQTIVAECGVRAAKQWTKKVVVSPDEQHLQSDLHVS